MRKQMIQEELNQNNFFQFKGKTDIVQLKKENDQFKEQLKDIDLLKEEINKLKSLIKTE